MGALFSTPKAPKLEAPEEPVEKRKTRVDPNRDDQIAEARRKKQQVKNRSGRRSLRIDLAGGGQTQTRSGISIG